MSTPRIEREYLSIDDIHRRYPLQFVLLGDPDVTDQQEVLGGLVLWHGDSREEMYRAAADYPDCRHFASVYTGMAGEPPDEDTEFIL